MLYLILLGAFQAIIVFSIFIISQKKRSSDHILSWIPVWIFVHLGSGFLLHTLFPNAEIHKQYYTFITLIYPPLLWIYATALSGRFPQMKKRAFVLFLPAILAAIAYFSIAAYIIIHNGKTPPFIFTYNKTVAYVAMLLFPLFAILSIRETRHIANFWQAEKQLVKFIAGIYLMILVNFVVMMYNNQLPPADQFIKDAHTWGRIVTYCGLLSICLAIGRVKILSLMDISQPVNQPEEPVEIAEPLTTITEIEDAFNTTKRSILPVEQQAAIASHIKQWMENESIYKDAELTLDKLATAMEISRHHLSETLNQYLGQSFYQLVNEYRIKEVIRLIEENKRNKTTPVILSLAFEAGFHSKSSFNQHFKKVTGDTPSAYLKGKKTPEKSTNGSMKSAFS